MFCEWYGAKDDGCKFKKTGVKLGSTSLVSFIIRIFFIFYTNVVLGI